jgi:hypothetical protein
LTRLGTSERVCYWHIADVQTALINVRFEGNNGHDTMSAHDPQRSSGTRGKTSFDGLSPEAFQLTYHQVMGR